jgi:hypothetical protein
MNNENIDTRKDKFFIEKFGQDWFTASPESRKTIRDTLDSNPSALGDDAVRYAQSKVGMGTMIGKAAESGFLNSVGNIAQGMRIFKDAPSFGDSLLDTAKKAEAIQYQPYAPKDDSLWEQSSSMAKNLLLGSVKMLSDPVATGAMVATDFALNPITRGLLSSAEVIPEAMPQIVKAAQRLNNPITASMNPYARSLIENTVRGASGNVAYDATQNAVEGTNHNLEDSALMGGAFGVVGSGAGMAWKYTLGDEAKWLNKYDSNANISAREQKANAVEAEAVAAKQEENLLNEKKQAEYQKINQEQSQQIAEQEQAKARYDAMPLEDKLNAQPEANIETVPRQDANGNIIPDRANDPSIYNNMKNNADMEDEISKLQPEQQQVARDYLDEKNMQNSSNADRQAGSIGKDYQENSVNDLIDAKKAMEDLDHQDNISSKLEQLGYPKDSKTFRDKLATDEFPTESYSDYMKRKTFDRQYSKLEQQDAYDKALSEDKINPVDDVKGNFTSKDDLLEKFKKADDNNELSLSNDFKNVFKLAGEMEHKKKMLQEKGVSGAEAEKIIKTYHGDDKYFKDAQAIRDSLNKEPMNFNNPLPKSVKEAKVTPSEDMQKLNELSKNPHFKEHLNDVEKSGVDRVDSSNSKNIDDSKTTNSDSGFKVTPKDVSIIKKALQDGKIDKTNSESLDRLSNDLELKNKEHAPEYKNKVKNELNKDENKQTIGDTSLDIKRLSSLNKIRNADSMTGEGQRQIDDGIKELNDVKAERDKIIVKDWSEKVGSGEEVNKLVDSLYISEKLNKICGE